MFDLLIIVLGYIFGFFLVLSVRQAVRLLRERKKEKVEF